jgi:hypothetical protein
VESLSAHGRNINRCNQYELFSRHRYRFETDEGSASLADLFRGRSQLLVYHFMFGPDWTAGCPLSFATIRTGPRQLIRRA